MPTLPGTHLVFSDQFSTAFVNSLKFDLGDWMVQSHVIPLQIELTAKSNLQVSLV